MKMIKDIFSRLAGDNLENPEKLKEKAKLIMIERGWDDLLIGAYLITENFISWSKDQDFDEKHNVGISNIKGITKKIDIRYSDDKVEFLEGEIVGIKFQLGGLRKRSEFPDGERYATTSVSLFIDEKRVLAAYYACYSDYPTSPSDYSLSSVEEFHKNPSIEPLLLAIKEGQDEKERKWKEDEKREEQKKYDGKFSF